MRAKLLKLIEFTPYLVIAGFGLFMFRGIFAGGFMSGFDNSFHFYDAYYLTEKLIPVYHWINGWSMMYLAGCPILVDYYQTGFLVMAVLNKVFFVPLQIAYKSVVLFSYVILAMGFFKFSSARFGRAASLIIALCLMLQKDIYCDRILGGVWSNYLALGIFFVFMHLIDKHVFDMDMKTASMAGFMLALLILTHIYVAFVAFAVLAIFCLPYYVNAISGRVIPTKTKVHLWVVFLALMVSAYYIYPFIVSRDYFVSMKTKDMATGILWSLKSFLGPIERAPNIISTIFVNIPIAIRIIFSFAGLAFFLFKEDDPKIRRTMSCLAALLVLSLIFFSDVAANLFAWWENIPFIGKLQTNRFLVYVHMVLYIFAAYGLWRFFRIVRAKYAIVLISSILLVCSVIVHYNVFAREASRTLDSSPMMADLYDVMKWVRDNVNPNEGRVAYQNTIGNVSDSVMARSDGLALYGVFTDVPGIGVARSASPFPQEAFMRTDNGFIFNQSLKTAEPAHIKETMDYFNAGYIVSVEESLEFKLSRSSLFRREAEFGDFSVFRLMGHEPVWVRFNRDAEFKLTDFEDQKISIDIFNKEYSNEILVNVAYHPFWQARLNGAAATILRDGRGLMRIPLAEPGRYRLELSFVSAKPLWTAISFLGLVLGLFAIMIKNPEGRRA